jgi:hypothetical protein
MGRFFLKKRTPQYKCLFCIKFDVFYLNFPKVTNFWKVTTALNFKKDPSVYDVLRHPDSSLGKVFTQKEAHFVLTKRALGIIS